MGVRVGDKVRYTSRGGRDITTDRVYEVIHVYSKGDSVRVLDDVADGHDLRHGEWEPVKTDNTLDWIRVYHENDVDPVDGDVWSGLTIYDTVYKWYCFRKTKTYSRTGGAISVNSILFFTDDPDERPLDPVRAAAMLLAFADEEAKL